ncbi:hypothetical protein H0H92_002545 [Tricholoma furcatifolium]|nr:hypothetical protein H0H92_002545 [Tricholoma furcatifolium]
MYRLMLYAKVFSVEDEDADLDEEDDEFDEMLQRERLARSKLLRDFATSELYELHSAAHFLVEIAQWADTAFQQQRTWYPSVLNLDNVLPAGPEAVLVAYREKSYLEMDEPMNQQIFSGFLHEPLKTVLEERKAKPPQEMSTHWTSLVDGARGANDTCKSIFLFKFIEGHWYYLSGLSSSFGRPVRLSLLSKGTSSLNFFYGFGRFPGPEHGIGFDQALSSSTYESILNEIHQIRVAPWNDWGKGDWLCERCIKGIFEAHLHLWLLERKRAGRPTSHYSPIWDLIHEFTAGDVIKEDCWWVWLPLPHPEGLCSSRGSSQSYMNLDSAWITNRVTCDASRHKKLNDVTLLQVKTSTIFVREVLFYMSQVDEPSFFERERDRLARDITASFEELLSSTNGLNRKLEEVLGMTKEYDTIAELWQSFYHLMRGPVKDADDSQDEKMGLPGTGGHVVAMKQSKS